MGSRAALLLCFALVGHTALALRPSESLGLNNELGFLQSQEGEAFVAWAKDAGKMSTDNSYLSDRKEVLKRFNIFQTNIAQIEQHNSEDHSYKLAVNEFADLTAEEFRSTRLGLKPQATGSFRGTARMPFTYDNTTAPDTVNWVEKGAVTAVKNQGSCGSCWAFSTTGSVEGINYLKSGELVSLSEQELVDCDTKEDLGCSGGLMDNAFDFIIKNGGLDTESDYGYWSFGLPCNQLREKRNVVTIDSYADVPEDDESALTKAIAHQPISVAICADPLQFYGSGIVKAKDCCAALDHGVLAVGYGEDNGQPYYLVKNSWGASWGEAGYFRLARNEGGKGTCAIANAASYPIKTSPNPKEVVDVCGWFGWSECDADHKCSCAMTLPLLGDLFCLSWGCAVRD